MTGQYGLTTEAWQHARDLLAKSGMQDNEILELLVKKPCHVESCSAKKNDAGPEQFAPSTAPRMARQILPESVSVVPMGGTTWLEEVAEEPNGQVASWSGDLRSAHVAATDAISVLLEKFYGLEHQIFKGWEDCPWPIGLTDAEQFYTLRDSINYVEQWLPGDCLRYPGLVGITGFGVAVDECVVFSNSISQTLYLGLTVAEWELLVRNEVKQIGGDSKWLDVAFSSLYGCLCLQNLEKAMLGGAKGVETASMDWKSLSGYFTRCEIALTAVTSFFLAAYSGLTYREQDIRPLSIAAASNAVIFDLAKRATGHGGGGVTEVDLGGEGGTEIRMRAHLTNRLLEFACDELPQSLTLALLRCWQSTSIMPLINDRYVERKTRKRATVPEAYLKKMDKILRVTGGQLNIPRHGRGAKSPSVNDTTIQICGCRPDERGAKKEEEIDACEAWTPTFWLNALAADRRSCNSTLVEDDVEAQSGRDRTLESFLSLSQVIPISDDNGPQVLQSIFDGEGYIGRPAGGLISGLVNH